MANEQQGIVDSPEQAQANAQDPAYRQFLAQGDPDKAGMLNFMDIGYAQAGATFGGGDPNVAAAWRRAGQNITGVLQQRWFQKEYETFEQQALQPLVQRLRGIDDSLVEKFGQIDAGQLVAPDGSVQVIDPNSIDAMRMKQSLLYTHTHEVSRGVDDLFAAAGKYGAGNPLITQRIHEIMGSTATTINALTSPAVAKQEQDISTVSETQARTGLLNAQAGLARRTDPNLRSGSEEADKIFKDPMGFLAARGPGPTASFIASGSAPFAETLYQQQYAKIEAEISENAMVDPGLGQRVGVQFDPKTKKPVEGSAPDPALVKQVAMEQKSRAAEMAAVEAANTLFEGDEGYRQTVLGRESLTRWMPGAEEPKPAAAKAISGKLAAGTIRETAKATWKDKVMPAFEQALSSGEIKSKKDIATWIRDNVDQIVSDSSERDPTSRATAKEIAKAVIEYGSRHWTDSELAREITGENRWFDYPGKVGGAAKRATARGLGID